MKVKNLRDARWLAHVREQGCMICGASPCDPAHIRIGAGGGMGLKPPDNMVVPLCNDHHRAQHESGERTFWTNALMADPDLALRVLRGYAMRIHWEFTQHGGGK